MAILTLYGGFLVVEWVRHVHRVRLCTTFLVDWKMIILFWWVRMAAHALLKPSSTCALRSIPLRHTGLRRMGLHVHCGMIARLFRKVNSHILLGEGRTRMGKGPITGLSLREHRAVKAPEHRAGVIWAEHAIGCPHYVVMKSLLKMVIRPQRRWPLDHQLLIDVLMGYAGAGSSLWYSSARFFATLIFA